MLDISKLGLVTLNHMLSHVAESSDDPQEYEQNEALIEGLRGMVGQTELREAMTELSQDHEDQLRRESDVIGSLINVTYVKGMAKR